MNIRKLFLFLPLATILVGAASIAGCTDASRAQAAYNDYLAAASAGDLYAARDALLKLVAINEDVADYWIQLGQVQAALGSYSDAYYALGRALELDRSDQNVLRMLTQIALSGGNLELADKYARQLEMLIPNDPSVKMTFGTIALRRGDLEGASRQAELILENQPSNSDAKVLQAKVLVRSGRIEDAIALLARQIRLQPDDRASHYALATVYDRIGDTKRVADLREQIWNFDRNNARAALDFIVAAFRSGDVPRAHAASLLLLKPNAPPALVSAILDVWGEYWPGMARIQEARRLSQSADREQRLSYAAFFNSVGAPSDALQLIRTEASLPVSPRTVRAHAIFALSLVLTGQVGAAKDRLHRIIRLDPDNVDALRARAKLSLVMKAPPAAINDAQKLVSLTPNAVSDRLLLAQSYEANGDSRNARRVLWEAFHDIPSNHHIYVALRNCLVRAGDLDSMHKADREFADQKQALFTKDFA